MSFDGANIQQFPDIPAVSAEILALRGWEGEKNGKKNMYAKSCLNSRQDPDRCHASPDYPTELFSMDHGDRLFEVNSTNSFKNLSP